ncbi:MAG: excinuclease ABC subunit UvrA [Candidatus Moranbacteria bacterium]|nr:excinuclease ABC subunit UvrA [Candidatus Moranbacteria bacterium]
MKQILIRGARENNLKNIDIDIPKNKIVVVSGVSGSGKSSFAFDTVYSEGYRRYMENLSSHAHYFLNTVKKPAVDKIENLCPAISIGQRFNGQNSRSTVGTATGIYDLLRVFYAEYGKPFCPNCNKEIKRNSPDEIIRKISQLRNKSQVLVSYPFFIRTDEAERDLKVIKNLGHSKFIIENKVVNIKDLTLQKIAGQTIEILVDKIFIEKVKLDKERILDSVQTALKKSNNETAIVHLNQERVVFCRKFKCSSCDYSLESFNKKNFSFNLVEGACNCCQGLGEVLQIDLDKIIPNKKLSIAEGAIEPWVRLGGRLGEGNVNSQKMKFIQNELKISLTEPIREIAVEKIEQILWGVSDEKGEKKFKGVANELLEKLEKIDASTFTKNEIEKYFTLEKCAECGGKRLKREFLNVKIDGQGIDRLVEMEITDLIVFLKKLSKKSQKNKGCFLKEFFKEIISRLNPLERVGVGYLNLNRPCKTLSGGEYQRIRIATQLYSGLNSVLYVLDEPTVGLHSRDTKKLVDTFRDLKGKENTLLVVEHDKDVIEAADYIVDFGSKAGDEGGRVVFEGSYRELLKSNCETAHFINKKRRFKAYNRKVDLDESLVVKDVHHNNLKNINLKIPLNCITVFAGVSGSGKSSLVNDVVSIGLRKGEIQNRRAEIQGQDKIQKIVTVNQAPIGRSPRSNPATYTGIFSYIRKLFSETKMAEEKGYGSNHFSFNTRGGRCEYCQGDGAVKIDMPFLDNTYSVCPKCNGKRYKDDILKIEYHGVNIADVLDMTVEYAYHFFNAVAPIKNKLKLLKSVGLGYLKLGQNSNSLSGGEAQRIKLASELVRKSKGNCLYILDEPTVGLHFSDIKKLFEVLNNLVGKGNSVFVIEHNMDVIRIADWVIELGPGGGKDGGKVIFEGTPEELGKADTETGKIMKKN